MNGRRFIQTLRVQNLLSFGATQEAIRLESLNVLIGPNAAGKSNVIETLGLLKAAPGDLTEPIRQGGGISEWLWKGAGSTPTAEIDATIFYPEGTQPLRYRLAFTMVGQRMELSDEAVENALPDHNHEDAYFYYRYQRGRPALNVRTRVEDPPGMNTGRVRRGIRREDLLPDQSVLSQRKDPDQYPELTYLGRSFASIALYREWDLGRFTAPRLPQKPDLPSDFLLEDASNLGLVLNDLQHQGDTKEQILQRLRHFYPGITDITTRLQGGTVQLFLHERGMTQPIPATRLSDGTLRYLCLLAVLLHPSPPPLVCIEEPELGMHPDVIPALAELLVAASQRTQLIITTHSDTLVSALTELPEAVMVCERDDTGTRLHRLDPEQMKHWLSQYSLGELWRMGEIGGTRW
jgi:predicted ATPase